jgi:hypothetical protein
MFRPDSNEELFAAIEGLVAAWCDRRAYRPLRHALRGYPMANPLTDGWADLHEGLTETQAFAHDDLTEGEREVSTVALLPSKRPSIGAERTAASDEKRERLVTDARQVGEPPRDRG